MKSRPMRIWKLGIALAVFPLFLGCEDDTTKAESAPAKTTVIAATEAAVPAPTGNPAEPQPLPPPPAADVEKSLSPRMREVVKMAQAGVEEQVILEYIRNSAEAFRPTAEEIVYLTDLGISEKVLTSLIQKKDGEAPAAQTVQSAPPAPVAQPSVVTPANVPQVDSNTTVVEAAPGATTVIQTAPPTTVVVSDSYFNDYLSPYGSWVVVEDYGRCWRPTVAVVDTSWRPYLHHGRWLWTDCGWYWQSDYSWGWTVFHYGRWHHHSRWGWVWVPGCDWGPAWVSWRYTDDYCGWAPLPPRACYRSGAGFSYYGRSVGFSFDFGLSDFHYTFLSYDRFCDPRPYRYCSPVHRNRDIYRNSVVVNNYIVGNNNTIINNGVGVDRIRSHSNQEIRKVAVRELPAGSRRTIQPDRVQREGSSPVVYRREAAPAPATSTRTASTANTSQSTAVSSGSTRRTESSTPARSSAETPSRTASSSAAPDSGTARRPLHFSRSPNGIDQASVASDSRTEPSRPDATQLLRRSPQEIASPNPAGRTRISSGEKRIESAREAIENRRSGSTRAIAEPSLSSAPLARTEEPAVTAPRAAASPKRLEVERERPQAPARSFGRNEIFGRGESFERRDVPARIESPAVAERRESVRVIPDGTPSTPVRRFDADSLPERYTPRSVSPSVGRPSIDELRRPAPQVQPQIQAQPRVAPSAPAHVSPRSEGGSRGGDSGGRTIHGRNGRGD